MKFNFFDSRRRIRFSKSTNSPVTQRDYRLKVMLLLKGLALAINVGVVGGVVEVKDVEVVTQRRKEPGKIKIKHTKVIIIANVVTIVSWQEGVPFLGHLAERDI